MLEEKLEELKAALNELFDALIEVFKIEEILKWLSKILDKVGD